MTVALIFLKYASCWQVSDRMDIFLNNAGLIFLNNTINIWLLTAHTMPSYNHKMAMYHHHVFRDIISPDVYLSVA